MQILQNILPELFLSVSIMFLLMMGSFIKNSFKIVNKLTIIFLIFLLLLVLNQSDEEQTAILFRIVNKNKKLALDTARNAREKLIYELLRVLRDRDWKKIVTHNKQGEYGHPRHRALHDILNHLRPEILWQFDKCKERLETTLLHNKRDLLKVYKSQKQVLEWFSPWYEKITKVNE